MATTKTMDKKKYKNPIIMPRNPARGQMPHDLAVADDLAAVEKQRKLDAYAEELEKENKVKLQKMADEGFASKEAPEEEVVVEAPKAEEPLEPKKAGRPKKNPFNK